MSKDRVEAFSDGVFAVALTLLVLGIHLPNIASHSSLDQYAIAVAPLIPNVVSFVLSFALICNFWVGHHYFFSHLRDVTIGLVWLNNLFLLWLCFMPFPTAMLGDHPTDQFPILVYGVNQLLAALTFFAIRSYASHNSLLVDRASAKAMGPKHTIPAIIFFTLSILFAFVNVYVSLACPRSVTIFCAEYDFKVTTSSRGIQKMDIKRTGSQPSGNGPAEYFTGTVRIAPLFEAPDPARARGASVTFEPGARTAWHTHPLGQTLIVTAGCGSAQCWEGTIEQIRPGDVIWFPPGEKHWHGATATTAMTHIAIQEQLDGKTVDWMEKVSDEQYQA